MTPEEVTQLGKLLKHSGLNEALAKFAASLKFTSNEIDRIKTLANQMKEIWDPATINKLNLLFGK